jgi:HTH-type transcriptional regulator/antitoxin HipB
MVEKYLKVYYFYRTVKIETISMSKHFKAPLPSFGQIKSAAELGTLIRTYRKNQHLTLEKVSGISNISMRFLSELERGKETAELGKVLSTLNQIGLEVIIQPRGYQGNQSDDE